jgi:anthranilate 1,2-dioxygenase small subunit
MQTTIEAPASGAEEVDRRYVALRHELRDLYETIGDLLDDNRVEELPDYFTDDCTYKVTSRENYDQGLPASTMFCDGVAMLRDRILAIRETQVYEPRSWRHFISGVRVLAVDGDTIRARANFLVTEAMSDAEPTLFMVGRYEDELVRRDGRLLFRVRLAICDNHHVRRSIVMPI